MKITPQQRYWIIAGMCGMLILIVSTLEYGIHTQWRAGDYALLVVIFITASGLYWFAYARRASSWGKTLTPLYVVMFIGFIIYLVTRKEIANYLATLSAAGAFLIIALRLFTQDLSSGRADDPS